MASTTQSERAAWDAIASGYDEYVTPTHRPLSIEVLRRVGLREGDRFLDVAAGSGSLSIPAAHSGASVTATDVAPKMLQRLVDRAAREGVATIQTLEMTGHALDFEDETFDVSGSQFGVMLFPDLPLALREMVRVTRADGTVFAVVYGNPSEVEFLEFFVQAIRSVVPDFAGLPMDPPPLPFQVADPDRFRARLAEAGLTDIRIETIVEELAFTDGEQLWAWLMNSNPISARLVAETTEAQRELTRSALDTLVRERAGRGHTAVLTNPVHVGIGRV